MASAFRLRLGVASFPMLSTMVCTCSRFIRSKLPFSLTNLLVPLAFALMPPRVPCVPRFPRLRLQNPPRALANTPLAHNPLVHTCIDGNQNPASSHRCCVPLASGPTLLLQAHRSEWPCCAPERRHRISSWLPLLRIVPPPSSWLRRFGVRD